MCSVNLPIKCVQAWLADILQKQACETGEWCACKLESVGDKSLKQYATPGLKVQQQKLPTKARLQDHLHKWL